MARYTFGGGFNQLVVAADAAQSNALKAAPGSTLPALYNKPVTDNTRVVVTDFLRDNNNDGTFETAVTSIVVDSVGYPPYFQGPDNLAVLYDLAGRRFDANDAGGADVDVNPASTVVQGIVYLATLAEVVTGTNTTDAVTPQGVQQKIDDHEDDPAGHTELVADIDALQASLVTKADLSGGVVPMTQIPGVASATADTLALRRPNSALAVGPAAANDEAVNLLQANTLFGTEAVGADVRHRILTSSDFPLSNSSNTVFEEIPGLRITDGASGDRWRAEYSIKYRASLAGGIKIQHKAGTAAVTNVLDNPDFESVVAPWAKLTGPYTAPTQETPAGGGHVGTGAMRLLATSAGPAMTAVSELIPADVGSTWSAGAWAKLGVGVTGPFRVDIQDIAADGVTVVASDNGPFINPNTGAWTQATVGSTTPHLVATGSVFIRVRIAYTAAASGGSVFVDAVQLENQSPLPAYGTTGGSGASALNIDGYWTGPSTAATGANDYTRGQTIRTDVSDLQATFGSAGPTIDSQLIGSFYIEIGGTGLTDQVLELEYAQKTSDATATSIVSGNATLVRLP